MTTFEIIWCVILCYFISVIVNKIIGCITAILHLWCMNALYDNKYWFSKGTTILKLKQDINRNETYLMCSEAKWLPIFNFGWCGIWFAVEFCFFILVLIVSLIKLIIFIICLLYAIIWKKILYKPILPIKTCLCNVNWSNTCPVKMFMFLNHKYVDIKKFILNIRIA